MAAWCLTALVVIASVAVVYAQQYTTPVPILKQINRHNEDGSYSYGYEAADGSFKIETKHPTGEVVGKYGYVDDTGSIREVEYGASRRGFEPAGAGINVAPPTLQGNYPPPSDPSADYDDGQYREDPSVYYKAGSERYFGGSSQPKQQYHNSWSKQSKPAYNPPPQPEYNPPQPAYNPPQQSWKQPSYTPPQPSYRPPAFNNYRPHYEESRYEPPRYNPPPQNHWQAPSAYSRQDPQQWHGHPASNFDVNTGSYSVSYSGRR